ncbi:hypothetical protein KSZ_46380 [Dictyobacter formicarum]|uniref:Uncharacterized protein n=1 Tax=Dictyobacter formicarum TaxID=2778368 RepID=A0ABQ3VL58_9CHLR|nr:hypothetical protein KSZ_46380 [Dictyobacter formicarum]
MKDLSDLVRVTVENVNVNFYRRNIAHQFLIVNIFDVHINNLISLSHIYESWWLCNFTFMVELEEET